MSDFSSASLSPDNKTGYSKGEKIESIKDWLYQIVRSSSKLKCCQEKTDTQREKRPELRQH